MNSNLVVGGVGFAPGGLTVGGIEFTDSGFVAPPPSITGTLIVTETQDIASASGTVTAAVGTALSSFFMFF